MAHTDKERPQKTSIVMDNFNSTANLATNPGFQSTLSLGTNVINEKDDHYEPFENREVEHPTSTTGSLVHLLKSSLGSGILAMPVAFKNSGLAVGAVGTLIVGVICTHCVHILVRTSHEVCRVAKRPSMGFAETCGAAFEYGPERLRGWASFANKFVDYALTATYLGASCVYVVFIAESFKEVIDVYAPESKLTVEMYCALTLVPLVIIGQIRNLKYLVPFSAVANLFLIITFAITLYYMYADTPAPGNRDVVTTFGQLPLFISTVIFAMEGIGVVMPVENEMAQPQHFLGCPGVLNVAMGVVVALYTIVGFFGYLKYGDDVKGSITLNLPQNEILAQSAKILMALAILFTYGLQFYVPMEIIWRRLRDKIAKKYRNLTQVAIRISCITASVALAAAFPDLELFIALVGAIFFSTLGLFVPALVDTVHRWDRGLGKFNCHLWKNCFCIALSFLALIAGSYYSIRNMINKL